MGRLEGKVAVVTGAGRTGGIGDAICAEFIREGAQAVIGTDMTVPESGPASETGDGLVLMHHDVTSAESWADLASRVRREFGQIDILVNNAGMAIHGGILECSLEDLRKVMAVNHDSIFLGIQTFACDLAEAANRHAGGGAIINTLSAGSYMPNAHNVGYHSAKAAARMLTMCAATELGRCRAARGGVPRDARRREPHHLLLRQEGAGRHDPVRHRRADRAGRGPEGLRPRRLPVRQGGLDRDGLDIHQVRKFVRPCRLRRRERLG